MSINQEGKRIRQDNEDMNTYIKHHRVHNIFDLRSFDNNVAYICIGQALADVAGYTIPGTTGQLKLKSSLKDLFYYKRSIEERKLEKVQVDNIKSHSTNLFLFKFDGKIYVWYFNPWGQKHDADFTGRMARFRKKFFDNVPENSDIFPKQTENARNGLEPSPQELESLWSDENGKIRRIYKVVSGLDRVSKYDKDTMSYGLSEYLFYAKIKSMATPAVIQGINSSMDNEDHYGVMHAFRLLKHYYIRRDIATIMPWQSMPPDGPQALSGYSREDEMICKHVEKTSYGLGDCALWTRGYQIVAMYYLESARSNKEVVDIIQGELKNLYIMGEKTARHFVGKVMMSTELGKILKPMKIVYKAIPIKKVQTQQGRTAFKIHVRKIYDQVGKIIEDMDFSETLSIRQKQIFYIFISFLDMIDSTEDAKKLGYFNRILVKNVSADMEIQMMVAGFIRNFPSMNVKQISKLLIDVSLVMISCVFSRDIFEESDFFIKP